MLYQDYKDKINRRVKIRKALRKYRVPILCAICTTVILIASFMIFKGMVFGESLENNKIEYGNEPAFTASAVFSDVRYEFCEAKGNAWTTKVPVHMGEYKMRVVSSGVFGERYSDEQMFTIVPRKINVVADRQEIIYGEKPGATASTAFGDRVVCIDFVFEDDTKAQTNVTPVKGSVKVVDKNGKDVSACYEISVKPKAITFLKRDVTVTVESVTTVYNDQYFTHEVWELSEGSLAKGDDVVLIVENSFTSEKDVGETENKGQFRVVRDQADITHLYNIIQISGKLTIEKRPITVHTNDIENTYTGQEWYDIGFQIDESTPLLEGHTISVAGWNRLSLVGEVENLLTFVIRDKDGRDVTSNYGFTNVCGKIKVLPREITVKTESATAEYNGNEQTFESYEVISEADVASGHKLKLTNKTAFKNVTDGAENVIEFDVVDENGNSVLSNYAVEYEYGRVSITKKNITVESDSLNGTYNGKAQRVESYNVNLSDLCNEHNIDVIFKATVTDCLDEAVDNEFDVIIRDENGDRVTENYEVNKIYGTLKLSPMPISIITGSASKTYDGEPLFRYRFDYKEGSAQIVSGQRVDYVNTTELVNADIVDNVFEIKIYDGDEDKTFNYDISYEYGELFVDRRPFIIESDPLPQTTYYDGKKHRNEHVSIGTADGFTWAIFGNHLVEVEFLESSYVEFATDDENNKPNLFNVTKIIDTETGEDVTGNYAPIQRYGLLRLEKRPIILMSGEVNAIYDGNERYNHDCYGLVLDIDPSLPGASLGLAEGHTPNVGLFNSAIDAGEWDNSYSVYGILDENGNDVFENYLFNGRMYGKIKIEPRPITLISKDDTKMYDGTPLVNTEYSVGGMGLVPGESLAYSNNATITNVLLDENGNVTGIENSFEFGVTGGRGWAENYVIIGTEFGTLTVTKRPITITSQDAQKVYDGKILYNDSLLIGGVGLAGGDRVECTKSNSITDVILDGSGSVISAKNTFEYSILGKNGEDASRNYQVTKEETGKLTVTKRPISVAVNNVSREYNALPLTPNGFKYVVRYGDMEILDGHYVEMELYGSITKIGSITTSHGTPLVLAEQDGAVVDKSHNYDVTVEDGTLTVIRRRVILNARFEEQEYTGATIYPIFGAGDVAHHGDTEAGLGSGDSISVIFTSGQRQELGTSTVRIKTYEGWTILNAQGEDVTDCYEVVGINNGALTVIPRRIFIRLHGNSKEYYDGAPIVNYGYTVDGFLHEIGHTISLNTVGSQTNYGFSYAEVIESSIVIKDKNGIDASKYYELVGTEKGRLSVENKRPVTVTSASDFFFYDGTAHKNEGYEIIDNCPYPMQRAENYSVTFTNGIMVLPGEYENTLTVRYLVNGTGEETTDNYEISYQYGTIIIGGVDIEITTQGGEKVYDGSPLTNSTASFNCPNGMPEGLQIQIIPTGEQTDVGTSENTYVILATINGSPFPTDGFNVIKEELGTLTVTPLDITISTHSGETVYSGIPFIYNVFDTNFYETEASKHLAISVKTAMLLDIGRRVNSVNSVDLVDMNGIPVSRDNFNVTVESEGTLTMYADHIIIESDRETFYYDGTPKSCPEYKYPLGHINPDHTIAPSGFNSFTEVGTHENVFTVDIVDADGNSVIEFYPDIELIYDTIIIEKRKIEIEAPTVVERYENGKIIYAPNEIVLPNDYLVELNDNIYGNEYSYEIDCNMAEIAYATKLGNDVEYYIPIEHFYITLNGERLDMNNFEITCLPGYLKFSDKLVEIEIFEVSGYYDGNRLEYFADDWDVAEGQLPKDCWLELDLSGIGLSEAGAIDFDEMLEYVLESGRLCVYRYNEAGLLEDMTHYFEFKFVGTPLTLYKAELVLTAGSATKFYDGEALTNNTYTITGGGLEEGHKITECKISGSITEAGTALNQIIDVTIVDMNSRDEQGLPIDITENYHITVISGVLTVEEDTDK